MSCFKSDVQAVKLKIAYIGGGSRGWARGLMSDLATESFMGGTVYLYDIDYKAAKANEIIGNSIYGRDDVIGKWHYKAVDTLKEALVFIKNEKGRPEAQQGEHDDLIMGLAITYYIRTQQRYTVEKIEKKEEIKLPF